MSTTDHPWVPETSRPDGADIDEDERIIRLNAQRLVQPIRFGSVPEGWTIIINHTRGREWTIETQRVARQVTWHFPDADGATLTLSPQSRVVHVSATRPRSQVTVRLAGNATRLYLAAGSYQIHGDYTYDLDVEEPNGPVTIHGPATPRRITGTGDVHTGDLSDTDVDIDGALHVNSINPTGQGRPSIEVKSLTLGSSRQEGQLAGPSNVRVHEVVTIHGSLVGPVDIKAGTINVTQQIRGQGHDNTTVTVTERLHVRGGCENATLNVTGAGVAALEVGNVRVSEPVVLPTDDDGNLADTPPVGGSGTPLTRCVVNCEGGVLVGDTRDTIIQASGPVVILGELARTEPNGGRAIDTQQFVFVQGATSLLNGAIRATDMTLHDCENVRLKATDRIRTHRCTNVAITAADLHVIAEASGCDLNVTDQMVLEGDVDSASSILLEGSAQLHEEVDTTVRWQPASNEDQVLIDDHVAEVVYAQQRNRNNSGAPTLQIGPGGAVDELNIGGTLTVVVDGDKSKGSEALDMQARLEHRAHLLLERPSSRGVTFDLDLGGAEAALTYRSSAGEALVLALPVDAQTERLELNLSASTKLTSTSAHDADVPLHPRLAITGSARVEVDTELGQVSCAGSGGHPPTLDVTAAGAVLELSGVMRLGEVDGRINGDRPPFAVRLNRRLRRYRPTSRPDELRTKDSGRTRPSVITSLAAQSNTGRGHVHGVDPTRLEFAELAHLGQLHVFEPDSDALIEAATRRESDEFASRSRAQKMATIADHVVGSAASGTSRSAALWAASRAHHAAANSPYESGLRWAHRALGYSQRPLPALFTWIALILVVAATLRWGVSEPWMDCFAADEHVAGPYGFGEQFQRIALLPTTLLRLSQGGASGYPPLFCNGLVHVAGVVLVGLAAVFFVVALRNYLRSPVDP